MEDILQAFLEHPTARSYRATRKALIDDPGFRGDPTRLLEVARLCQRQEFAKAAAVIERMMPEWSLSPRVHGYAAWVAEELGDEEDAELERFLLSSCLQGLLDTGDGSRRHPFLVTYISDEHDLLCWLGETSARQRLVAARNRQFDVLTAETGREFWFEVSGLVALPRLGQREAAAWDGASPTLRDLALSGRTPWN